MGVLLNFRTYKSILNNKRYIRIHVEEVSAHIMRHNIPINPTCATNTKGKYRKINIANL